MRPLKITISAFGTYLSKTVIDFTEFGSEGLYLITGDTGSGKTTIFDAITFALYGEPSGNNRDASMLRSTLAGPDQKTEVELEFDFRGDVYKIRRIPGYKREKISGKGGFTNQIAEAELTMPNGDVIGKVRDVDAKIKDLLGITKEQFGQIAMIAQGDFQKVLYEKSEKRKEFLRTLFKTHNYQQLQDRLKTEVSDLDKNVKEISEMLNHDMLSVSCGENSPLYVKLNEAKSELKVWCENSSSNIDLIQEIISEDKMSGVELEKSINDNQGLLDNVKLQIAEIEKLKEDRAVAAKLESDIRRKEKLVEELEETVSIKNEVLDKAGDDEKKKTLIANDLSKYDELDKKLLDLKKLKDSIDFIEKTVSSAEINIEKKSEEIKSLEDELSELKDVAVNHQLFLSEKEKLENRIQELKGLKNRFADISKLCDSLLDAQNEYKTAYDKSEVANNKYAMLNKAYLDGQAGIIAGSLEDGKPCPVCGSIHHPSPCVSLGSVPSDDDLKKAKAKADQATSNALDKSQAASVIAASKKAKEEEFESAWNKIFDEELKTSSDVAFKDIFSCDKLEDEISDVKSSLDDVNKKLSEESVKIKRKSYIEEELPGIKAKLEKMKSECIQNSNKLIQDKTEAQGLEKQSAELKEGLAFENKAEANKKIAELERKIDFAKKTYDDALKNFNKAKESLDELRGSFTAVKERIESSKIDDEEAVEVRFNELSHNMSKYNFEMDSIKARLVVNEKAIENILDNIKKLEKIETKWNMVKSLSDTVNGSLAGHEKIPLEVYIQTAYLEKILYHANKRLLIMSDNQYELVRTEESAKNNAKTGLDLSVVDHYTGTVRSVKSLSGGECFQASLALALGLSDEVTSSAGGIRIDTMFIDEGFGTLDSETIQKAYKALISVTEANKLVGIISHVDYLKEKIDKQIVVKKSRDKGSFVTINA